MSAVSIVLIVLNAAVLVCVIALFFVRRGTAAAAEQQRRDIQSAFSDLRGELAQNAGLQSSLIQQSFTDYMKFLMEFRDAVSRAQTESAARLSGDLRAQGERSDVRFAELLKSLNATVNEWKNAATAESSRFRHEQMEFQTRFQQSLGEQMERNRQAVDLRLKEIQTENAARLDEMKKTVDEKLQTSMEKHFNESFKLISERLEQVHKGLGEMQSLASGVGDLKKVLTNVKTRGNLGEIQLSALLEQYLAPDQYAANVSTVPKSTELVEFAVKMPGRLGDKPVWLPIDSKFPVEDYNRLLECYEQYPRMSPEVRKAQESFARTVKKCASDIHTKYIYPPETTAFGLMFVPSEGIYAEILRQNGLFEQLQNDYKIVVTGPSNLVAFLNSLQLGFKTLAIEKRSHEVWNILAAVKTEFSKFGEEMEATQKSLQAVCNHVEKIGTRSRVLERKLKDVQELPSQDAAPALSAGPE